MITTLIQFSNASAFAHFLFLCSTFRPQINASEAKTNRDESICHRLYELARCKETRSREPSWEEREMKECTFRPAINKRRPVSASIPIGESASEQKHVQRVRQKQLEKMLCQTAETDNTPSCAGIRFVERHKPKTFKNQMQVMFGNWNQKFFHACSPLSEIKLCS